MVKNVVLPQLKDSSTKIYNNKDYVIFCLCIHTSLPTLPHPQLDHRCLFFHNPFHDLFWIINCYRQWCNGHQTRAIFCPLASPLVVATHVCWMLSIETNRREIYDLNPIPHLTHCTIARNLCRTVAVNVQMRLRATNPI